MTGFDEETLDLAARLLARCRSSGLMLVTAESCTGGLLAGALTAIPGSSDVLVGGFVTYANTAKMRWIGVPEKTLQQHGAVSSQTAAAMALGASRAADGALALSTTGIAGPSGGSAAKPVGLVYIGKVTVPRAARDQTDASTLELVLGDIGRDAVRRETVKAALRFALA